MIHSFWIVQWYQNQPIKKSISFHIRIIIICVVTFVVSGVAAIDMLNAISGDEIAVDDDDDGVTGDM